MPEIVDGFTVMRQWSQEGDHYFPCIDVEMALPDGQWIRRSRIVRAAGPYRSSEAAQEAARAVEVRGVAHDSEFRQVIIKLDTF